MPVNSPIAGQPTKTEWRARLLAERAALAVGVHLEEAHSLAGAVGALPGVGPGRTVCAYLPFGSEPGSLELLDALVTTGARVLLPVVPALPGALGWADYTGPSCLVAGRFRGLREPAGPPLAPEVLAAASLVLVPALAVDHRGVRLGRGAGFYDRSLPLAASGTELIAVVRDSEVVPALPSDPHDVRMTAVLTPGQGLRRLPFPSAAATGVSKP